MPLFPYHHCPDEDGFLQPVSVPIIRSAREALHKELDECDGLRLVDDIHQEGADNGHDHESTSGHAAETETTE